MYRFFTAHSFIIMFVVLQVDISVLMTDVAITDNALKQSIRVNFVNISVADQTHALQVFSGNPGYQPGYSLLVRVASMECVRSLRCNKT